MLARKNNLVTNFGKIMDPLADKILVYSALCLFIESDVIKAWMLIIILAREFAIAGMRTVAASEGRVLAAGMSGKIKTVLQMVSVIVFLLALALGYQDPAASAGTAAATVMTIGNIVFYAALIMTVYSGCEYIVKNKDIFSM
jgi:CDP-diacylglycerol--glycerol-3-phosphate 3-phosphatidyltransferase/cardiolipin synthase